MDQDIFSIPTLYSFDLPAIQMDLSKLKSWAVLKKHADRFKNSGSQSGAFKKILNLDGIKFDLSNQLIDEDILTDLVRLTNERNIDQKIDQLISGEIINKSENQASTHMDLRSPGLKPASKKNSSLVSQISQMTKFEQSINSGSKTGSNGKPFTDLVQIGIGGSHLGTKLLVESLSDFAISHLKVHFISNIDPSNFLEVTKNLNPESTLFVVVSKSFRTLEMLVNFKSCKSWFSERTNKPEDFYKHCVAVTQNVEAAAKFGINKNDIFVIPKEVGGRYSIWSAGSLAAFIYLGSEVFLQFLSGAQKADDHFVSEKNKKENIPILMALISLWNYNLLGSKSHALLVYSETLSPIIGYLQQLEMESNGKSCSVDNEVISHTTLPIIWGGIGTNGQHSYHQLLHQGTESFSTNFFIVAQDKSGMQEHHDWLLANAFAQATALRNGIQFKDKKEFHKNLRGGHPSSITLLEKITPSTIGTLLALQEHKVFCESVLWNINPFDQWGVEHGKELAEGIFERIHSDFAESKQSFYDSYL